MNIDFNRICKLAGLSRGESRKIIRESVDDDTFDNVEETYVNEEDEVEPEAEEGEDDLVEVDINELMSEIRRAKKIIKENNVQKQRNISKKRRMQENKLKRTIAREVENVLAEMEEHDSSWLYGKRKPKHSKKGYSNQGRTIPGLGFRKY